MDAAGASWAPDRHPGDIQQTFSSGSVSLFDRTCRALFMPLLVTPEHSTASICGLGAPGLDRVSRAAKSPVRDC
jgi:hypothetical protein